MADPLGHPSDTLLWCLNFAGKAPRSQRILERHSNQFWLLKHACILGYPSAHHYHPISPRAAKLLAVDQRSTSIHLTTAKFYRFTSRVGPIFWVQDLIEEIYL